MRQKSTSSFIRMNTAQKQVMVEIMQAQEPRLSYQLC